jgi:hypothetical protein
MSDIVKVNSELQQVDQLTQAKDIADFLITGNLASFSKEKQIELMVNICKEVGVSPILRPLQLINFQGKSIWYLSASGAEAIAAKLGIIIETLEEKELTDKCVAMIRVKGTLPNGRTDTATAYLSIGSANLKGEVTTLKGEAYANAMMKLESKARRRLIVRLAGLKDEYVPEESEIETKEMVVDALPEKNEKLEKLKKVKVIETNKPTIETSVDDVKITYPANNEQYHHTTVKGLEIEDNSITLPEGLEIDVSKLEVEQPKEVVYDRENKEHRLKLIETVKEFGLNIVDKEHPDFQIIKQISSMLIEQKVIMDEVLFKSFIKLKVKELKK